MIAAVCPALGEELRPTVRVAAEELHGRAGRVSGEEAAAVALAGLSAGC